MKWWWWSCYQFALGLVAALALGWLFGWLFVVPWLRWAAVFLQLLGLVWVVRGILQTSYGVPLSVLLRSLARSIGKREGETGKAAVNMPVPVVAGQGRVAPFIYSSSSTVSPEELEQRLARERSDLEQSVRRQGEQLRQRDVELEVAYQEQIRRLREEVIQKHPQEVMGVGWAAIGILLSGF